MHSWFGPGGSFIVTLIRRICIASTLMTAAATLGLSLGACNDEDDGRPPVSTGLGPTDPTPGAGGGSGGGSGSGATSSSSSSSGDNAGTITPAGDGGTGGIGTPGDGGGNNTTPPTTPTIPTGSLDGG
jgi:hypothetical protein